MQLPSGDNFARFRLEEDSKGSPVYSAPLLSAALDDTHHTQPVLATPSPTQCGTEMPEEAFRTCCSFTCGGGYHPLDLVSKRLLSTAWLIRRLPLLHPSRTLYLMWLFILLAGDSIHGLVYSAVSRRPHKATMEKLNGLAR